MEKRRILLVGWERWQNTLMLDKELKEISKKYDILFADQPTSAFMQIASSFLVEKQPIAGLVFKRNFLTVRTAVARAINDFAEECNVKNGFLCAVNLINSDQDSEARDSSVSSYYARIDDWDQVLLILDNNIK